MHNHIILVQLASTDSMMDQRCTDRLGHLGAELKVPATPYNVTRFPDTNDWPRHFRTTPDRI